MYKTWGVIMSTIITTIIAATLLIMVMALITILNMSLTRLSNKIGNYLDKKMEQDLYTLKHNYSVKDSRELLEYLVNQKIAEWQIYNVDPSSDNYMSEENMKSCIEYIIKNPGLKQTDVKTQLNVSQPTVSKAIKQFKQIYYSD